MSDDRRRSLPRRGPRFWGCLCAAVALAASTGCAGWSSFGPGVPDVKPQKAKRARETARLMCEQRDRGELQAAQFALQQGDVAGSQEMLERVLKRDPKNYEAALLMAEVLILQQQPEEARRQLEQLVSRHPQDPRVLHAMGSLLEAEEKPQEALSYFERASRLAPDNHEYRISCQTAGAGPASNLVRQTPAAPRGESAGSTESSASSSRRTSADFAVATDREEDDPAVAGNGALLASAKDEADLPPLPAAQTPPAPIAPAAGSPEADQLLEYGRAALAAGSRREARECFRRARRAAPKESKIPIAAAVTALKHDELELAVEIVQDGLDSFPNSAGLHRLMGVARYRLGDLDAAKASFEQSLSLDKSNPLSYFLMGSTLKKLGQTEAAEQSFREARRLDPRYGARR